MLDRGGRREPILLDLHQTPLQGSLEGLTSQGVLLHEFADGSPSFKGKQVSCSVVPSCVEPAEVQACVCTHHLLGIQFKGWGGERMIGKKMQQRDLGSQEKVQE